MTPAAVWGRLVGAGRHDETVPRDLTLPPDYAALLADLKNQVRAAQLRAHRVVNTELLTLYWRIGDAIRTRQEKAGWGAKVIDQLAGDLRAEFPEMTGLSRSNVRVSDRGGPRARMGISLSPDGLDEPDDVLADRLRLSDEPAEEERAGDDQKHDDERRRTRGVRQHRADGRGKVRNVHGVACLRA